jgi:hypothetical protein
MDSCRGDWLVVLMANRLNPLIVFSINSMMLDPSFQSAGDQKTRYYIKKLRPIKRAKTSPLNTLVYIYIISFGGCMSFVSN